MKAEVWALSLLVRVERLVVNRYGKYERRGGFVQKDREFSLSHV